MPPRLPGNRITARVVEMLERGPLTRQAIIERLGHRPSSVYHALQQLVELGVVDQDDAGDFRLRPPADHAHG